MDVHCCYTVAEMVILRRNLSLDGTTLTVKKASRRAHDSLASRIVDQNPIGKGGLNDYVCHKLYFSFTLFGDIPSEFHFLNKQ